MTERPIPNILAKIRRTKEKEVETLLSQASEEELMRRARDSLAHDPPRGFLRALAGRGGESPFPVRLIAEVKKASPSKGIIREDFAPAAIAAAYERGGASAISCLTDEDYFMGSLEFLGEVRHAATLPVLRKDFLIHPAQIAEARCAGADAVLLIARLLGAPELESLQSLAQDLGMDALVEVHDEEDLKIALAVEPRLVGINNRDLDTFAVDTETASRLRGSIPEGIPVVAESGIVTHADMRRLQRENIAAALVGESLMREEDIEAATRRLIGAT